MLLRLAVLFITLPLMEWFLLMVIKGLTGFVFTLALVILTGFVGAWLARREGLHCWRRVQEQLADGAIPADSLIDGLIIFVAGALLVTPGVITDTVGFGLLVPPIRGLAKRRIVARLKTRIVVGSVVSHDRPNADYDEIIDVQCRQHEDPQR